MVAINVASAQIKTAAVEIKTITVSGKQVTLSVFRQLHKEDLIDYKTMQLNGIPWGRINYFWKDEGSDDNDYHIIWQNGSELRRDVILKEVELRSHKNYWSIYRMNWYNNEMIRLNKIKDKISDISKEHASGTEEQKINIAHINYQIKMENQHIEWALQHNKNADLSERKSQIERLEKRVIEVKKMRDDLNEELRIGQESLAKEKLKCQKVIDSFKDLPQLFIAV